MREQRAEHRTAATHAHPGAQRNAGSAPVRQSRPRPDPDGHRSWCRTPHQVPACRSGHTSPAGPPITLSPLERRVSVADGAASQNMGSPTRRHDEQRPVYRPSLNAPERIRLTSGRCRASARCPGQMHAQLIRPERYGDPLTAFVVETVATPHPGPGVGPGVRHGCGRQLQQRLGCPRGVPSMSSQGAGRKPVRQRRSTSAAVDALRASSGLSDGSVDSVRVGDHVVDALRSLGSATTRGSRRAAIRSSRRGAPHLGLRDELGRPEPSTQLVRHTNCSRSPPRLIELFRRR